MSEKKKKKKKKNGGTRQVDTKKFVSMEISVHAGSAHDQLTYSILIFASIFFFFCFSCELVLPFSVTATLV